MRIAADQDRAAAGWCPRHQTRAPSSTPTLSPSSSDAVALTGAAGDGTLPGRQRAMVAATTVIVLPFAAAGGGSRPGGEFRRPRCLRKMAAAFADQVAVALAALLTDDGADHTDAPGFGHQLPQVDRVATGGERHLTPGCRCRAVRPSARRRGSASPPGVRIMPWLGDARRDR